MFNKARVLLGWVGLLVVLVFVVFGLTKFAGYHNRTFCGQARDMREFNQQLREHDIRQNTHLPIGISNISYFLQPRRASFFVRFSMEKDAFKKWVDELAVPVTTGGIDISFNWVDWDAENEIVSISNENLVSFSKQPPYFVYDHQNRVVYFASGKLVHSDQGDSGDANK